MSEGALTQIRRFVIGKEDGAIYAAPADWLSPRGCEDVTASADFERIADNRQRTSRRAGTASHNGPKKWELGFRSPLHSASTADLDCVLENVAGAAADGSSFTYNDSGSSATTIVKSAGTHDPLLLLTVGGVKEVRPVKSVSTNDATLAIRASGDPSAAENPARFYTASPTASETTLAAEWDRDQEGDTIAYAASGGVCDRCAIEMDTEGRVFFDVHIMGADWTDADQTPNNITAPSSLSGHFLGYAAEAFLQDIGTPAVGAQKDISTVSIDLAPTWIARKATRANVSGAVPGSATAGWKRGVWFSSPPTITVTKNAQSYLTAIKNRTPYAFMISWSLGGPGATATDDRCALYLPRVIITAAVPTDIDGLEGCQLTLEVEEEALSAPYLFPYCLAFFS
jgi:hypothetical protein